MSELSTSMNIFYYIMESNALMFLNIILALTIVFFERKHVNSTLAWLMILVFLPGFGFILYIWIKLCLLSAADKDTVSVQEGDLMKAVVYLELATRAGERAAARVKNVVLQRLSTPSRDHAMLLADQWRALPATKKAIKQEKKN